MHNLHTRISCTSFRIITLITATLLLLVIILTANIWRDYDTSIEETIYDLKEVSMLMEEHTRSTIDSEGIILSWVEDQVHQYGIGNLGEEKPWQSLWAFSRDLPGRHSLWVFRPDGKVAITSLQRTPPTADYSDRAYFIHARDNPGRKLFISPALIGRMSGEALFTISRRLENDHGEFLGVAVSSLRASYLQEFYRRLNGKPGSVFAIYREDGRNVVRMPAIDATTVERMASHAPPWLTGNELSGVLIGPSPIDGIDRILAFRRMPALGLVVLTAIPVKTALAGWRERTQRGVVLCLGSIVLILALACHAHRAATHTDMARRSAEQASQSKTTFFASASHDLRQPYQAMRLFWSVTEQRANFLGDPPLQNAVARLGQAMTAGEELLESLLDIATIEAGHVLPRIKTFSLADIIEGERASFQCLATARGLSLRAVSTTAMVRSDPVLLARILRNLVVNAIKYTDKGGIVVGCRRRGSDVLLQVWDSGLGIDDDKQTAIFEDFYQIGNSARQRSQGLGLGLSVVSRTARLLGHKIDVRSRPGHGSTFTVTLPLADSTMPNDDEADGD